MALVNQMTLSECFNTIRLEQKDLGKYRLQDSIFRDLQAQGVCPYCMISVFNIPGYDQKSLFFSSVFHTSPVGPFGRTYRQTNVREILRTFAKDPKKYRLLGIVIQPKSFAWKEIEGKQAPMILTNKASGFPFNGTFKEFSPVETWSSD